jgi:hypothetical protein
MAEAFPPFPIERTIGNLTFYMMEGRNFVRKKSSLTRRKVLYSPQFKNTRHFAGLMAKASKIGSQVYNALPEYWRQGWMYRSFTGEAYKMIKAGKTEAEIQQVLLQRYVEPVISKGRPERIVTLPVQPKRTYRKLNTTYWRGKTLKSIRRKANRQQLMHNAALLARASKVGSALYRYLPLKDRHRCNYQQLTGWAMMLLKDEWDEADIIAELSPTLSAARSYNCVQPKALNIAPGIVIHPNGQYHFITSLYKRYTPTAITSQLVAPVCASNISLAPVSYR